MPRTIQIHPLSLLVGVGIALLGVVAMAQMPAAKRPAAAHDSGQLQVAHPRDWVHIEEGTPYVVPATRFLVITGLGSRDHGYHAVLLLDGTEKFQATSYVNEGNGVSLKSVPLGFSAPPNSQVEVKTVGGNGKARAWGYLVDA